MKAVISRDSPPVWPLDATAFHGWCVQPNEGLRLERNTYFLNRDAPQFTFPTSRPVTTHQFLTQLNTDELHKNEHWSSIEARDVYFYDPSEVREAFSDHERYLLSDLRDFNADALKIIRSHKVKLESATDSNLDYLVLDADHYPMRASSGVCEVRCGFSDGASRSRLRLDSNFLKKKGCVCSFGLVLNFPDAQKLLPHLERDCKFYAYEKIEV